MFKEEYVPDKGYCIKRYDEQGCNICSFTLSFLNLNELARTCTKMLCTEVNKEKANQCIEYLSKEELLKKVKKQKGLQK